jgi:hypothetical protein
MRCKQCESENLKVFSGELAIHFPGLENLNKPHVLVFPKLNVCFECGFVEFGLPAEQLAELKMGGLPAQWNEPARA